MAEIAHTVYSTSNSDYQAWQCELLDATFEGVGQPGRLVRLCSVDSQHWSRPFETEARAEVVRMPCWMVNERTGDRWGIANKPASMRRWLVRDALVRDDDVVLFLDPDMVFVDRVELDARPGTVVGQRWVDEGIEHHPLWDEYGAHVRDRIVRDAIVMYPFAATAGDMRKLVDRFLELCHVIRDDHRDCWGADMFALVIAMLEADLEVETRDHLGVCNNWLGYRDEVPKIIHFPVPVLDRDESRIWFKQDYTRECHSRPWNRPPPPTQATNITEELLLEIIHMHVAEQEERAS